MRVNLAKDPSVRSGTTAAYAPVTGATLSINDDYAFYGNSSVQVSKAAINGSGITIAAPVPVVAGLSYAISAYVRLPNVIPHEEFAELILQVEWTDSLGTLVQTTSSSALKLDNDDTWYRIGGVWTAPVGATLMRVSIVQPIAGTDGADFLFDALLIEQADYIGGYFDNLTQAEKNRTVDRALSAVPQMINGVRLGADIILNDLIFNTIDEFGTMWVITELDGWWGQTSPDMPDITRGTDDGSYDVQGRLGSRTVTLQGFFVPANAQEELSRSIDRLVTAMNITRVGGWLLVAEEPTKAAWVRLSTKPQIRTTNARGRTNFSITVRAADPVKYHWNDARHDGFTNLLFKASEPVVEAENIGTASVSGVFTLTGPMGAWSRIYNSTTEQVMTLREPLRGAGLVARAREVESKNNIATVYTTEAHGLRVGDQVTLLNMVTPFSESTLPRTITQVSSTFPFSFSFPIATDDVTLMPTNGQIYLVNNDVLTIDTYNKSVAYNGESSGHRYRLSTLTDWISLGPGRNTLEFADEPTQNEVVSKMLANNEVTLTTSGAHFLIPGEQIKVELPETAQLSRKSLTGNIVTLTTAVPHGFSTGDTINVNSTESNFVTNKSRTSNVVTVTTQSPHGAAVGDSVKITFPTSADPVSKSLTSNVATLNTPIAHGYSVGDSVTVGLNSTASISAKALSNGQATLTTSTPHGFAVGDTISITMPASASVVNKARSGSQVVMTTSTPHGFSVGDTISITLPTSATLSGTRSIDPATNLVTLTTSAAHGFSAGDRITVSVGVPTTATITNRTATASACTLTTSANHNYAVGEKITVTGSTSRYNGTFYITAVTANTVTYANAGATEASTAGGGTITNITIRDYYNGSKIIEAVPTTTTLRFYAWDQAVTTSSTTYSSPTLTNTTNTSYNGTKTIVSTSGTQFSYNF